MTEPSSEKTPADNTEKLTGDLRELATWARWVQSVCDPCPGMPLHVGEIVAHALGEQ